MSQALGGFILGAVAVFLIFFFDPGLAYYIQLRVHDHGYPGRFGHVALGVAQPFAPGDNYSDTSWYADDQDADTASTSSCEEVIALENRSDRPLSVGLEIRYRDDRGHAGGFEAVDGPDGVFLGPGERAEQTIRADAVGSDGRACAALNRHGLLVVDIEACPDEGGGLGPRAGQSQGQGQCEEEQVDPADAVMHEDRGGPRDDTAAPRRDYGRTG